IWKDLSVIRRRRILDVVPERGIGEFLGAPFVVRSRSSGSNICFERRARRLGFRFARFRLVLRRVQRRGRPGACNRIDTKSVKMNQRKVTIMRRVSRFSVLAFAALAVLTLSPMANAQNARDTSDYFYFIEANV